jgi:hypothetical protein
MPNVAMGKAQTISYPAPGSLPPRHDEFAVDPHVVVLFGATGDLARGKLIPGLAYLDLSELAPHIEIVATSLEDLTREEFLESLWERSVALVGRSSAGQDLPAGDMGPQRDPSADGTEREAAPARA